MTVSLEPREPAVRRPISFCNSNEERINHTTVDHPVGALALLVLVRGGW